MSLRPEDDRLLIPTEVAALFRVDRNTVTRWASTGRLSSIRTLGGAHRYSEAEVRRFLDQGIYPSGRKIKWPQLQAVEPAEAN